MSEREVIRRFLDVQYGAEVGYAWLAVRDPRRAPGTPGAFSHSSFRWPTEADSMVNAAIMADCDGFDVYFSVHLTVGENRWAGQAVSRRRLHLDIDRDLTDSDTRKIAALGRGAWCVESGSGGHVHLYVDLSESIDEATYNSLEESLRAWFGSDVTGKADSKIRDNDVLRIPTTLNHKPGGGPVLWDGSVGEEPWDVMELQAILPAVEYVHTETSHDPIQPAAVEIPQHIRQMLDAPPPGGDRSAKTFPIVNACVKAGLTKEQTMYVLLESEDQRNRFEEKRNTVWSDIHKAYASYVPPSDSPDADSGDWDVILGGTSVSETPEPEENKYEKLVLSLSELQRLPPPTPLIEGLLYDGTLARLSGHPGSLKSYLAISLACAVASQVDSWSDYVVHRHGPVLYVAAEGASGIALRIDAWCRANDVDPSTLDMKFLTVPVQFGKQITDMQPLVEYMKAHGIIMAVFDTQSRCTVGLDENSAKDMGEAVDEVERLVSQTGATVLVLHHSTRTGANARGSSVWDGAVWSELACERDGMNLRVHCQKHKDAKDGCDHHFYGREAPPTPEDFFSDPPLILVPSKNVHPSGDRKTQIVNILVNETPAPWVSIAELERDWGIPKATASKVLNALIKEGIVTLGGTQHRPKFAAAERVRGGSQE